MHANKPLALAAALVLLLALPVTASDLSNKTAGLLPELTPSSSVAEVEPKLDLLSLGPVFVGGFMLHSSLYRHWPFGERHEYCGQMRHWGRTHRFIQCLMPVLPIALCLAQAFVVVTWLFHKDNYGTAIGFYAATFFANCSFPMLSVVFYETMALLNSITDDGPEYIELIEFQAVSQQTA